jgi:actin-like ATPase involved in cell morphogenesis
VVGRHERPAVGLDFGTSTTLVAESQGGFITPIPIGRSTTWMYSLAAREGSGWLIGEDAETRPVGEVIRSVKSYITNNGAPPKGGPVLTRDEVHEVIRQVFSGVVTAAAAKGLDLTKRQLRLGCPAQWVGDQRMALAARAQEAGLDIHVDDMIDEPIAAGVDWIFDRFDVQGERTTGRVLVIDIGGGTLDVALLQVTFEAEPDIAVLACRGAALAGDALDDALATRIADLIDVSRGPGVDREDLLLAQYLRRAARRSKIRMSSETETEVRLDDPFSHLPVVTLTRSDVDDVLQPQLLNTLEVVDLTLREAALRATSHGVAEVANMSIPTLRQNVTHVVLAGGMAQVPAIQAAVHGAFPTSEVHVMRGDLATTRIVRGFARTDAFESLNLHRPGLDIVLTWNDASGGHHERLLFPAFSPVFDRDQVAGHRTPEYVKKIQHLDVGGIVPGEVLIRSVGGQPIELEFQDINRQSIPVRLDGWMPFSLTVRMDGTIVISDASPNAKVLRVGSWPYIRFSGMKPAVSRLSIQEVDGRKYGDGRDAGWWHK